MMAISTETQGLLNYYNQKKALDVRQIEQITTLENGYTITTGVGTENVINIYGPRGNIDNFREPIEKLDSRIFEINVEIAARQEQILEIGQEANLVGCGTAVSSIQSELLGYTGTIVYRDALIAIGYGYTAPNPFYETIEEITPSTVGLGTYTKVEPVPIGEYFSPLVNYPGGFLNPLDCPERQAQIDELQSEIDELVAIRDPLVEKVNILKNNRSRFELQEYAYTIGKEKLNAEIEQSDAIISFLTDPENEEWL